jgi:hypothetical protein
MSTTHCTAVIIPARLSEAVRIETIDTQLTTLQALVEGDIEAVTFGDWHMYLNEEGKILGLPANIRAGHLVFEATQRLVDVYCGDVVFLGATEDGDEADAPAALIRLAEELFDLQPAS